MASVDSTTAIIENLISIGEGISLSSDPTNTIEFNGQKYTPDESKGYCLFELSHAFPVVTAHGQALMPSVIAKSYQSLLHQTFDYEHMLAAYDEAAQQDRILGTVLAVDFPRAPVGGFKVTKNAADSPGIRAIANFTKLAKGMSRVIGQHQTGRHTYAVSQEVVFAFSETAFAIERGTKPALTTDTPADMDALGWDVIPWINATPELIATYNRKKKMVDSLYKGRRTVMLMGGLNSTVHYSGVGLVMRGAEREAEILRLAASDKQDVLSPLTDLLSIT